IVTLLVLWVTFLSLTESCRDLHHTVAQRNLCYLGCHKAPCTSDQRTRLNYSPPASETGRDPTAPRAVFFLLTDMLNEPRDQSENSF
uniref:Uncharacterized protein n=1 Tax=Denticeps clupeoides TaxID=299321 RepID=A0AAY4E537_9TELE